MKTEGLILTGVIGFCALFGVGVSQASAPMVHSIEGTVSEIKDSNSDTGSEASIDSLRTALKAHYPNLEVSDEALNSLSCAEETGFVGQKSCYKGATKEVKRYGKAAVVMDGTTVGVQLASMPGGAYLLK
jgi:hypothetical protein